MGGAARRAGAQSAAAAVSLSRRGRGHGGIRRQRQLATQFQLAVDVRGGQLAAVRARDSAREQQAQAEAFVERHRLAFLEQRCDFLRPGASPGYRRPDRHAAGVAAQAQRRRAAARLRVVDERAQQLGESPRVAGHDRERAIVVHRRTGEAGTDERVIEQKRGLGRLERAQQPVLARTRPVLEFVEHACEPARLAFEQLQQFPLPRRVEVVALQQVACGLQRRQRPAQVVREPVEPGHGRVGHASTAPWRSSSSRQIAWIAASSGGFTRCRSKPASRVRRRSSGWPQPVTATSSTSRPPGSARSASATS
jgi:hypothetical protein